MKEDYVSFEIAKLLKEKGFDETCRAEWLEYIDGPSKGKTYLTECDSGLQHNSCSNTSLEKFNYGGQMYYAAPTQQMAKAWLREKKNIDIDIHTNCGILGYKRYTPCIQTYKPMPKPELLGAKDEWNDRWVQKTIYLRYENDKGLTLACKDFSSYEEAVEAALKYCLINLII